jgi:hypothetical protein
VQGARWRDYILVGLVQAQGGEQVLRDIVHDVEALLNPANASLHAAHVKP